MALFTKREVLDLASLAVADRADVRAARELEVSALAAWEAAGAAVIECLREQGKGDESTSSPARQLDSLRAMEASDREPDLRRDEKRRGIDYRGAVLHREAIEKAARAGCTAARVAGRKVRVEALFDALDAVVPANDALIAYEHETAALLGVQPGAFEHAWAEFFDEPLRESVLEFRRRNAADVGLL